jgi:NitT/TauT family transport system substrate-binding protein
VFRYILLLLLNFKEIFVYNLKKPYPTKNCSTEKGEKEFSLMKAFSRYRISSLLLFAILTWTLAACGGGDSTPNPGVPVRIGYFPNLTHAAALVGLARKTYEQDLAPNKLQTTVFNAGGDLVKVLLGGSIDIGFLGPDPAIYAYVQSKGSVHVLSGASSGGVLFVVHPDSNINGPSDLHGKKIADPQRLNTQDVSLRHYLQQNGLKAKDQGGDVEVISTSNANTVNLFKLHEIDGAWIPEAWASRLVAESNGKVLLDERTLWPGGKFVTTNIVVRTEFQKQHPDIVKAFLKAEVDTIQYVNKNPADAKNLANEQLASILPGGKKLEQQVLDSAFDHLSITYEPLAQSLFTVGDYAYSVGYLTQKPDLTGIYDLDPLNSVLSSQGLSPVTAS